MAHCRSDETVESALRASDDGVPDRINAELHGVAVKTIRRWRSLYQRQGRPRGGSRPVVLCPRCDGGALDESAYACLLGWYLGDGHIAAARRGVFVLSISNDPKYPELSDQVADLMRRRVKPTASPCRRSGRAVRIESRWKHWPCLFPQHGPGRKHLRRIELADWQAEIVGRFPGALVRGLFHSDGCRAANWATQRLASGEIKRYEYVRYLFANESEDIIRILASALDWLGVPWRRPRKNVLAVSRFEGVEVLERIVGPKS